MRLTIEHHTQYRYDAAPKHLIQLLRLTPRSDPHQRIQEWRIQTPGQRTAFQDAFGNHSHTHVLQAPQSELALRVFGVVDVTPLVGGVLASSNTAHEVPSLAYLVPTALTAGFLALDDLAKATLPDGLHSAGEALHLAAAVCQKIQYTAGHTDVTSTAEQAFVLASGVCQDHAHVMIAACRSLGVSARYVSGYVDAGHDAASVFNGAASHAWVDVWLADQQHWVSIDVTNNIFASDSHCRLAVGRDYLDACPVRGMRVGGQIEQLDVSVKVQTSNFQAAQQ